ncbi:MAG: MFS transporter [Proteobacteria bacterium]|nr:MFS transporter [Pseudomonadota bacterium]
MPLGRAIPVNGVDGLPTPRRYFAITTIALAVLLSSFSTNVVNVALPAIARDLGSTDAASIWVVSAFQITLAVALLPFGTLGEIYGYRPVYLAGLVVFTLASLAVALSTSLAMLTCLRVVQGLGAAGILGVNIAMLRFVYPRAHLGRGIGINGFIAAVATTAAPPVGALILSVTGWPWLFALNVPIAALALAFALFTLPETPRAARRFDTAGAVLSVTFFGGLLFAANGVAHGHPRWLVGFELAASLGAGIFYLMRERGHSDPLVPLDLFRIPQFRLSVATSVTAFAASMQALLVLPFHLEQAMGYGGAAVGLLLAPWPAAQTVSSILAGRLSERRPAGLLGGVGLVTFAGGLAALALMPDRTTPLDIAWRMALCGVGFGLFQSPNNVAIMTAAPPRRSGAAGGTLGTARLMGQSAGAALAALMLGTFGDVGATGALAIGAAVALIAAAVSTLRLRASPRPETEEATRAAVGKEVAT